ncbi:MAG: fluoride efflux transporter CrcB [Streptosporangiales bacterium]|nr:fluoride efflux transporter CrcB [Streptosporangiales bacterium]
MTAVLVFVGGAVGAPLRYLVDRLCRRAFGETFPWGTVAVNLLGSFLLGALTAASGHAAPGYALLGTGICGGFTTFSTFAYETVRLGMGGAYGRAALNAGVSLAVGVAAAAAGFTLVG